MSWFYWFGVFIVVGIIFTVKIYCKIIIFCNVINVAGMVINSILTSLHKDETEKKIEKWGLNLNKIKWKDKRVCGDASRFVL